MKPSSAFSSTAWQELHSLLAEAAPFANTSCLLDAGGAVAAIEMRPRARSFEALLCPAAPVVAKWTAVVFEVDWTLHAAVLKLDRQVVEAKEFRLSQTLELVEFLKSHPFLNSDLIACEGSKAGSNIALPSPPPPSADFIYEKVSRSNKCELLLSDPPPSQPCSNICQFCSSWSSDAAEVKPPEPKKESGFIANDLDLGSVKLEIQDDDGPYYDDGECYGADDGNDHDWVDDAADDDYDYERLPRKSATIFQCGVCGKKYSRRANYTRHMYLHKTHENGKSENLPEVEVAGLRIKVESNLASSDVNETVNNAAVKKTGDSAARKKRGPYKSRQGRFTNDVCAGEGGLPKSWQHEGRLCDSVKGKEGRG